MGKIIEISSTEALVKLTNAEASGKTVIGSFTSLPVGSITGSAVLTNNALNVRYYESDRSVGIFVKANGNHTNGKPYKNYSTATNKEMLAVLIANPTKQFTSDVSEYEVDGKKRTSIKMDAILN